LQFNPGPKILFYIKF